MRHAPHAICARELMPIKLRRKPGGETEENNALPAPDVAASGSPVPATNHPDEPGDQQQPAPPFLSLREAADWLCVSISTLKRLIAKCDLPTIRVGARRKIPADRLAAYIARDILLPSQVLDILQSEED
jgi:excisionase family DNA binding protein